MGFVTKIGAIKVLVGITVISAFLQVSVSNATMPSGETSLIWMTNAGRLTIAPDGGEDLVGGPNDYKVEVVVNNAYGNPIPGIPATDFALYSPLIHFCSNPGGQADGPTDLGGYTTFSGNISGGVAGDSANWVNCDEIEIYVLVQGIELGIACETAEECLRVDSPDLNGDGTVNVTDFGKFGVDKGCNNDCDPCHDFNEDGKVDIADQSIFASFYNRTCP